MYSPQRNNNYNDGYPDYHNLIITPHSHESKHHIVFIFNNSIGTIILYGEWGWGGGMWSMCQVHGYTAHFYLWNWMEGVILTRFGELWLFNDDIFRVRTGQWPKMGEIMLTQSISGRDTGTHKPEGNYYLICWVPLIIPGGDNEKSPQKERGQILKYDLGTLGITSPFIIRFVF